MTPDERAAEISYQKTRIAAIDRRLRGADPNGKVVAGLSQSRDDALRIIEELEAAE